jgi:hypothetical protein
MSPEDVVSFPPFIELSLVLLSIIRPGFLFGIDFGSDSVSDISSSSSPALFLSEELLSTINNGLFLDLPSIGETYSSSSSSCSEELASEKLGLKSSDSLSDGKE